MPARSPAWLDGLDPTHRQRLRPYGDEGPPSPMLAKLAEPSEIPAGWGYQRKWDGMRVLADTGHARLWARSGRDVTTSFPDVAEGLATVDREAVVDGELVVLREGTERFELLQRRMNVGDPARSLVAEVPVQWAVFDVLALDGYDVRALPLREREPLLHELAEGLGEVIVADTVAHGHPAHQAREAACRLGWEGLIAKDPQAPYRGGRQGAWRKLKCLQRERFRIVGYRELAPGGGVGSLVLADPRQEAMVPVGSAGTGLTDEERARLRERLQPLRRETPAVDVEDVRGEVRWLEPELSIEVAYSETTPAGNLRHPRLAGLGSLEAREAEAR